MNYYEHHLGDYAEATVHLSFVEDAAYSRLLRKVYASEAPLPAEIRQVQRLVAARTREEREAVENVLREFFELREDGWHNQRADEEIARYQAGEPAREARKASQEARLRRHREERARLFADLSVVGQHPPYNVSVSQLRALHGRFCAKYETPPATRLETPATPHATVSETPPATLAMAAQSPVSSPQSPVPIPESGSLPQTSSRVSTSSQGEKPLRNDTHAGVNGENPGPDPEAEARGAMQRIRAVYPEHSARTDWIAAENAARTAVSAGEATWPDIADAVDRYAAYAKAGGCSSPKFVMAPHRFLASPAEWRKPWTPPGAKVPTRYPTADELEMQAIERMVGEGMTDAQIATELDLPSPDIVRAKREELAHAGH